MRSYSTCEKIDTIFYFHLENILGGCGKGCVTNIHPTKFQGIKILIIASLHTLYINQKQFYFSFKVLYNEVAL